MTYGTTEAFLSHFGLESIKDLPGLAELRASGLLDGNLPPDFSVPEPTDVAALMPDEVPLEDPEPTQDEPLPLAPGAGDAPDFESPAAFVPASAPFSCWAAAAGSFAAASFAAARLSVR